MPSSTMLAAHFFLQLAVVLIACRACGLLLVRLGQPQVVGDMVAGFLLGPLFAAAMPAVHSELFPASGPSMSILYVLGQLGLVLYLFVVGLSFDSDILRDHLRPSAATGAVSLGVPLIAGVGLGLVLSGAGWFPDTVSTWQAMLFTGTAIAISAFPVLARIVFEQGLTHTRIGTIALACAAIDDVAAWILFATVLATVRNDPVIAVLALTGGVLYATVVLLVGRPVLRRFAKWAVVGAGMRPATLPIVVTMLLLCAWFTDVVGGYAVFGAFLLGAVMPRGQFAEQLRDRVEPVTTSALLPMFFVYTGLQLRPQTILTWTVLLAIAGVTVTAAASKGAACTLASRRSGLTWRDSMSVGALMNARGLMELVLVNAALAAGLITDRLFTVFAVMTLVTTVLAVPLHRIAQRTPALNPASSMAGRGLASMVRRR